MSKYVQYIYVDGEVLATVDDGYVPCPGGRVVLDSGHYRVVADGVSHGIRDPGNGRMVHGVEVVLEYEDAL